MNSRPRLHNLYAGQKLRDTVTEKTYRVTFVDAAVPTVKVATPEGIQELTSDEFMRMEFAS